MHRLSYIAGLALLCASLAFASQDPATPAPPAASESYVATLTNGFSIRHVKREVNGDTTRLFISAGSFVDVRTADIAGIQAEPSAPVPVLPQTAAPPPKSLDEVVKDAGARHQLDPDFISSVIHAESAANPRAVSPKGAQGLMQLMPGTAAQLGVKNAFSPEQNVDGGTRHLSDLMAKYHNDVPKALAAYNAGTSPVARYGGVPPYHETRVYVARIIRDYNRKKTAQGAARKPTPTTTSASTTAAKKAKPLPGAASGK